MSIAEQLLAIAACKSEIKNAIEAKGITTGDLPFNNYASLIASIGETAHIYKCVSADAVARTWSGKLYDGKLSAETTQLTFSGECAPSAGGYYSSDGLLKCNPFPSRGIVAYLPFHADEETDETGLHLTKSNTCLYPGNETFPCAAFNGHPLYINLPPFFSGSNPWTVSVFAKCDTEYVGDWGEIFSFGSQSALNWVGIGYDCGTIQINTWDSSPIILMAQADTAWHHYSASYDGNNLSGYLDGVLIGTRSCELNLVLNVCCVGSDSYGLECRQWRGNIAELKCWNRTLSATEISLEYSRMQD